MTDSLVRATAPIAERLLRPRIGAFLADSGGLCHWVSSDLCDIAGLSRHDLVGQFWFRVFAEEDRKDAISRWEACTQSGVPFSFLGSLANGSSRNSQFLAVGELIPAFQENTTFVLGLLVEVPDAGKNPRYDRLSETIDKLQRTERERFDLSAALNVADTTINQLQSELNRSLQKNQDLTKRIDELGKNIGRLEEELAQTCSAKFGLESQIMELRAAQTRIVDDQQKQLVSVRTGLESDLVAKTEQLKSIQTELEALKAESLAHKERAAQLASSQTKETEEFQARERELSERVRALEAAVEREKAASRTRLEERDQEHAKAKAELDGQLLKMLGEASDLLHSKKQMSERITHLDRRLEKADEREKELLGKLQALETQLSTQRSSAETNEEAKQQLLKSDAALAAEQKKNQDLVARLADLSERLAKANEEIEDGKTAIRAISHRSNTIEELKTQYEKLLLEGQQRIEVLSRDLAAVRAEAAQLRQRPQPQAQEPIWALQQVSRSVQGIFHDIFTLLGSATLPAEQQATVGTLKTSADLISNLISGLLDVVGLENNKASLHHDRISLKRQLRKFGAVIDFKASQRGIAFSFSVDESIPEIVFGDWPRMEHALTALLGSILRLLPADSNMYFQAQLQSQDEEYAKIQYSLDCTAIDDAALAQHICALAASTTAHAQRSPDSLGFSIAERTFEILGSQMSVLESAGTIRARLICSHALKELNAPVLVPMTAPVPPAAGVPAVRPPSTSLSPLRLDAPIESAKPILQMPAEQRRKVLLAEDNRINQNVISRILKRHNFEVAIAPNGKDALEKATKQFFDLILMDCQMPQMDGYDACRGIRNYQQSRTDHSRIIGMSAHLDMDGRERCLSVGMDEYISKPIQEEKLIELIKRLLEE